MSERKEEFISHILATEPATSAQTVTADMANPTPENPCCWPNCKCLSAKPCITALTSSLAAASAEIAELKSVIAFNKSATAHNERTFREQADDLAAASARIGELTTWRLIETAPKDGTRIWLADAKNMVTGYWSPPVGAWRCDWQVGEAGDKPTHWQPLPAALSQTKEGR